MIREYNPKDLEEIDEIGLLIKLDFVKKNCIEERSKLKYVQILVYEEGNIIKGFIEIENHFEITDIINIAVLEKYQNQSIATKLLKYIIENTTSNKLMLEVNETNIKALNFYKKNKFIEINRRKKYYGQNDAIIMERKI